MSYPERSLVDSVITVDCKATQVACPQEVLPISHRHPKVFIPLKNGKGVCPYCGTTYLRASTT